MMTKFLTPFLFVVCFYPGNGQQISGRVINEATKEPLPYVTISIVNKNSEVISNEKGFFRLDVRAFSPEVEAQFSMIGFEAQTVQIKSLVGKDNIIELKEQAVTLSEVIVKPQKTHTRMVGTKSSSTKNMTGWGGCGNCGDDIGGVERGIKININKMAFVEKVNFHVAYFGYDSMLLRLHIRKIENDRPTQELINNNIYIRVKSTGWHEIDLRKYNLSLSQDAAVSLEWIKAWGKIKGLENSLKLSVALLKGTLFVKDGIGERWTVHNASSPGIYVTIEEP